jgi:peptidyl-prolyl cis-trans isomerase SurA
VIRSLALALTVLLAAPAPALAATPIPVRTAPPTPARRPVDRVAAIVNGDVVTQNELARRAGLEWDRVERLPAGPERDQARIAALRRAFELVLAEKLFEHEAKHLDLEITDAQVDAAVEDIKKRNGFDDEALAAALREQGIDRAAFRAQIKRELTTYQLLQYKVRSRMKASDEDLRAYYQAHPEEFEGEEEVHVRHIFLPLPEGASDAEVAKVEARGDRVVERLKRGEPFEKVAREVSKAPTAADGGDLGWIKRHTIQKSLEDAAFALQPGQISGLVRAGPGFHVLEVTERRREGGKPFEQAKDDIRARLLERQGENYRQQYVAELKKSALVEVKIPELKD